MALTPDDIAASDTHFDVAIKKGRRRTSTLIEAPSERMAYLGVLQSMDATKTLSDSPNIEIFQNEEDLDILGLVDYSNDTREIRDTRQQGMLIRGGITVRVKR
jgi:hypothetical protein